MHKLAIIILAAFGCIQIHCSTSKKTSSYSITEADVTRIESALSHDSMEGRKVFTPGIDKAAAFISNEMKEAGLMPFQQMNDYYQTFTLISNDVVTSNIRHHDSTDQDPSHILCLTDKPALHLQMQNGYNIIRISKMDELLQQVDKLSQRKENTWVLLDKSMENILRRLKRAFTYTFPGSPDIVFTIVPDVTANDYAVDVQLDLQKRNTSNLIGMLPGKKHPEEFVIFSGHYDHLGYNRPNDKGDSLYNGANDDASGITAVLTLAKQFARQNNNDRSLLFVAFAAEELGTLGSEYFATSINPDKVVAMINIEMIGTPSKWGNNSAYFTGFEKSDLAGIMQQNTDTSVFKFYPDPYPQAKLFYRSDNASLAKRGVPAHTISTSQMDQEPHYHKPSDEISTLDMPNMTSVIKAIAVASQSIIHKKDTPTRIPALEN